MDEILNLPISEITETEFDCSCGKHHSFNMKAISIKKGAINDLPKMAEPFKDKKILVVFDSNTYKVAGKKAVELLKENGFDQVKELLFEVGDDILIPDEKTLGRILIELDKDCALAIAVGSGVINDSVKYVTAKTNTPYIIVGTAPSMDGYVSAGAPIICDGFKLSPQAHLAYGVIGDTDILSTAPYELIAAGFGDIVGKITAIADWDVAVEINHEYRCNTCVTLVNRALDKVFKCADKLKQRNKESLGYLMEALILTGVAMALCGVSRPASGSEHMLAHYWEMDEIKHHKNPEHHGIEVGVATAVVSRFAEELKDILPETSVKLLPNHEFVEELLTKVGAPISPKDIGISKELFKDSLINAHAIRERYSILRFAVQNGRIDAIVNKLTNYYYGN